MCNWIFLKQLFGASGMGIWLGDCYEKCSTGCEEFCGWAPFWAPRAAVGRRGEPLCFCAFWPYTHMGWMWRVCEVPRSPEWELQRVMRVGITPNLGWCVLVKWIKRDKLYMCYGCSWWCLRYCGYSWWWYIFCLKYICLLCVGDGLWGMDVPL